MSERFVATKPVEDSVEGLMSLDGGPVAYEPTRFEQAAFRNFRVEYAYNDGDFVVHFFVPDNALQRWSEHALENWWLNAFATTMSDIAQEHFRATIPRIMAKYTMETASWWFKAQGYDYLLDPQAFLLAFFERLDDTLPGVDGPSPAPPATTAPYA